MSKKIEIYAKTTLIVAYFVSVLTPFIILNLVFEHIDVGIKLFLNIFVFIAVFVFTIIFYRVWNDIYYFFTDYLFDKYSIKPSQNHSLEQEKFESEERTKRQVLLKRIRDGKEPTYLEKMKQGKL